MKFDSINLDIGTRESFRTEIHPDRDGLTVPDHLRAEIRSVYGLAGDRELTADVITPKEIPENPRPAIVFLHGGGWFSGSPSQFHFHGLHLASQYGIHAVSVDYRLSHEAPFPAALQDSKCALRWVRSQCRELNIDSNKIAVCGGSAGAHLSSMILTTAGIPEYEGAAGYAEYGSEVNLGILFNGEFDMWGLVKKGSLLVAMEQFMNGKPDEVPERYDELSSIQRIHPKVPPCLLLHGTLDRCVSHEQSIAFHKKLKSVGVHSEIEIYEGKEHAWFNKEPDRTITIARMEKFLVEQFNLC